MTPYMADALARAYGALARYASLHDADPTTVGDHEAPGVDRISLTWTPDGTGTTTTDRGVFTVPADTDIAYIGLWSSDGIFLDSVESVASFPEEDTYPVILTYTQAQTNGTD